MLATCAMVRTRQTIYPYQNLLYPALQRREFLVRQRSACRMKLRMPSICRFRVTATRLPPQEMRRPLHETLRQSGNLQRVYRVHGAFSRRRLSEIISLSNYLSYLLTEWHISVHLVVVSHNPPTL